MSTSQLTVDELLSQVSKLADHAAQNKALTDMLQQIGQAATDIVDLLEQQAAEDAAEDKTEGKDEKSAQDMAALIAVAVQKAVAGIRIPAPQVTVQAPEEKGECTYEVRIKREPTGAMSGMTITRKS